MDAFGVFMFLLDGRQARPPIGLNGLGRLVLESGIKEKLGMFGLKMTAFFRDSAFSKQNRLFSLFQGL